MAYLVIILVAFYTKGFFNSRLCRGEYGFFKTYFLYGGLGSFAIYFLVMLTFGRAALNADDSTGIYPLLSALRLGMFCLAVYLTGIAIAVYKIRSRSEFSPLMNLYCLFILVAFVLILPTAVYTAPVYFLVYAAALFVFYKFAWNEIFINKPANS